MLFLSENSVCRWWVMFVLKLLLIWGMCGSCVIRLGFVLFIMNVWLVVLSRLMLFMLLLNVM